MPLSPFNNSTECSLGIELELQLINPRNGHLISRAKDLIRNIRYGEYSQQIKPEVTQSMIEINSAVHKDPHDLLAELLNVKSFLVALADKLDIGIAGGGTHPFQLWKNRKIFPAPRYRMLARKQGYLARRFTVFGQHVHIGCNSADDAIYLSQTLARYIPQFIALSASSPFYQGADTAFDSARSNVVSAFSTCGHMPFFQNWQEYSAYYDKLCDLKIIESIKDVYWDIRPKSETGTVEVRVFDTPLTIKKAVKIAVYVQAVACYLLQKRPLKPIAYDAMLYNYNRFQASRYGFEGNFIDPYTEQPCSIADDIVSTITTIWPFTTTLNSNDFMAEIQRDVVVKANDTKWIRATFQETKSFKELVLGQSKLWMR